MTNRKRAPWLAGLAAASLIGCHKPGTAPAPVSKNAATTEPARGPVKVKSDGACLQLGELQQSAMTAAALGGKVSEHLAAGRAETARRLVQRFPDASEEAVLGCEPSQANTPTVRFIAAALDADTNAGWQAHLNALAGPAKGYAAKRADAIRHLREGDFSKTTSANLPAAAPPGPALVEAHRLHGQALLLAEKPKDAAAAFGAGARAAKHDPVRASACVLMCGEAQRRAGQAAEAKTSWAHAVEYAAAGVRPNGTGFDPVFWERAAYLKPVDANWPEPVVLALSGFARDRVVLPPPKGTVTPEMWVWAAIGQGRLDRGECHAALSAFKRAETMTTDPGARDGFGVAQARALLMLNQTQAASALLVAAGGRTNGRYAPAATAMIGAMKLSEGAAEPAHKLLSQALTAPGEWPGRAEAEADLGLACLSTGDETTGLRWLAAARVKFQAAGEIELLGQSWQNEARYWDSAGRAAQATAAREAARAVEATRTNPTSGPVVPARGD